MNCNLCMVIVFFTNTIFCFFLTCTHSYLHKLKAKTLSQFISQNYKTIHNCNLIYKRKIYLTGICAHAAVSKGTAY